MVNTTGGNRSGLREAFVPTLAGSLVLMASFVNFLNHNDYPLARPEVGLGVVFLLAVALAVGLIYAAAGRISRAILQILLVCLAFDLNFDGWLVAVLTAAVVLALNRRMMPFIGVAAGFVLATGVSGGALLLADEDVSRPSPDRSAPASDAPAVLHLVLDEHVGVEGMLGQDAASSAMRSELRDFYTGHGFRLFGGAYSEYFHTINSIPQAVNFGQEQQRRGTDHDGMALANNAYFDHVAGAGYRIEVYQTAFLQFCDRRQLGCHETRKQDYRSLDGTTLGAGERAGLLVRGFASLSPLMAAASTGADRAIAWIVPDRRSGTINLKGHPRVSAITALRTVGHLTDQLRHARPGEFYFAHLLLPHDPYSLRADCSIKPVSEWLVRRTRSATRAETERAYFDQVRCLNRLVAGMIRALDASEAGENTVVIAHGDHGYRDAMVEPTMENLGRFTEEALVTGHSTLFAVRAGGIPAGYDDRRLPLSALLSSFAKSGFKSVDAASPAAHTVVLGDRDWRPVRRHKLPRWWTEQ